MNLNLNFDKLQSINEMSLSDEKARKRIVDYLYQLTEQLRYWQNNIGLENLDSDAQQRIGSIVTNAEMMASQISDIDGNISSILQTIGQISLEVQGKADGNPDGSAQKVNTGSTVLTPTSFEVAFNGNTAMHVDSSKAVFDVDTLTATGEIFGNVVNRTMGRIWYDHVPFNELQSVIDELPKQLDHKVYIDVYAGSYVDVAICGFSGNCDIGMNSGSERGLQLTLRERCNGRIRIESCSCPVYIVGLTGSGAPEYHMVNNDSKTTILVYGSPNVWVKNVKMQGKKTRSTLTSGASDGIASERGSFIRVENCLIDCMNKAFYANTGGRLYIENCSGGKAQSETGAATVQNAVGIRVEKAGMAFVGGTVENGQLVADTEHYPSGHAYTENSYGYLQLGNASPKTHDGVTPVDPTMSYVYTASTGYRASFTDSSGEGGVVNWSAAAPRKGQHTVDGSVLYDSGIWVFSQADLTAIHALTNVQSASVTITRDTAWGSDGEVEFKLFSHAMTGSPGNRTAKSILTDTGLGAKRVGRGQSVTFSLTQAQAAGLIAGSINGFGIRSGDGGSFMQAKLTGCVINITVGGT